MLPGRGRRRRGQAARGHARVAGAHHGCESATAQLNAAGARVTRDPSGAEQVRRGGCGRPSRGPRTRPEAEHSGVGPPRGPRHAWQGGDMLSLLAHGWARRQAAGGGCRCLGAALAVDDLAAGVRASTAGVGAEGAAPELMRISLWTLFWLHRSARRERAPGGPRSGDGVRGAHESRSPLGGLTGGGRRSC